MHRINRTTYGVAALAIYAVVLGVSGVSSMDSITTAGGLVLALLGPARIHDFGLSAWYLLVPVVAAIAVALAIGPVATPGLAFLALADAVLILGIVLVGIVPGRRGANRYGLPQGHVPLGRRK